MLLRYFFGCKGTVSFAVKSKVVARELCGRFQCDVTDDEAPVALKLGQELYSTRQNKFPNLGADLHAKPPKSLTNPYNPIFFFAARSHLNIARKCELSACHRDGIG